MHPARIDELPIEAAVVNLAEVFTVEGRYDVDFADVREQESAKRALTITAAGHHNVLMIGPPGTGETVYKGRFRAPRSCRFHKS